MYKNKLPLLAILLLMLITCESFHCGESFSPCSGSSNDTTFINTTINPVSTVKLNDTIWINSIINDTLYFRISGTKIVRPISNLSLNVQPYKVVYDGQTPKLSFANIEFNPVIKDGLYSIDSFYNIGVYAYSYRRAAPYNYLKIGFVPGKIGLYAFEILNNNGYGDNSVRLTDDNNVCKYLVGVTNIDANLQNKQFWDSLHVSQLPLVQSGGYNPFYKNDNNYFFINVVQ